MGSKVFLSFAMSVIPIMALGFVGVLLLYKIYVKVRSKFDIRVNCWFCNRFSKVPYLQWNHWTCVYCEQYNGFTKDGDYNREMIEQLDCSNAAQSKQYADNSSVSFENLQPWNGFCNGCNEAQRLKVEKLAQFEPKRESRFDEELKAFRAQLEEQYRLCITCDRHLKKVLREKKKMVLGSKFFDFIIKGTAATFKQPPISQHLWKKRVKFLLRFLTVIHLGCLLTSLPTLTLDSLTGIFGHVLGERLFLLLSHIVALSRAIGSYTNSFCNHKFIQKIVLFFRTIFVLILYSLGFKMSQLMHLDFASVYFMIYPFMSLILAFFHNTLDGFKLTRYSFLLVLWSSFAAILPSEEAYIPEKFLLLVGSIVTLVLSGAQRTEDTVKLHHSGGSSFHKMYSDEYWSDDESIISQPLNYSTGSVCSVGKGHSFNSSPLAQANKLHFQQSPLTSSVLSLNNLPRAQASPNTSFTSYYNDDNKSVRPQYGGSVCNFRSNIMPRSPLFASNIELSGYAVNNANGNPFLNTSFAAPHPYRTQQKSDDCLLSTTNQYTANDGHLLPSALPFQSPYSASSSSLYNENRSKILTPSRFSVNSFPRQTYASSWLSGGYFNQRPPQHSLSHRTTTNLLREQREQRNLMTGIHENLSRTSSQSSGFESQNDRANFSRENSTCPETADIMQRTRSLESPRPFQSLESNGIICNGLAAPPVAGNMMSGSVEPIDLLHTKRCKEHDSFNLRKFNEDLPTLKRGDLLRKWQQSQMTS